jgi:2-keto-4-pentenoate hydratase/2-oxohepta-3-ene-1,7-dioic acid hydratase in catechol pathway
MRWVRFEADGKTGFGVLNEDQVTVYEGDLFGEHQPTSSTVDASTIRIQAPCTPGKIVALWNNFHALAEKLGNAIPDGPLYLLKPSTCVIGHGEAIVRPAGYDGRIMFEGELGIVIGRTCKAVSEEDAPGVIKGYTCVNDVTAFPIIEEVKEFPQWTRAKGFDTFGALGPVIAEIDDPMSLTVKTLLNGRERQNYPVNDIIIPPYKLVSLISQDMTLEAGDVIACGTSLGVMPMKPGTVVEVIIDGIGTLRNSLTDEAG